MIKFIFFFCLLCSVFSLSAFNVTLQSQDGAPYKPEGKIDVIVDRSQDANGVETIRCRIASRVDEVQMVRISAEDEFKRATTAWDGKDEILPPVKPLSVPLYMDGRFLMIASWNDAGGMALAAGAEDFNSYVDGIFNGAKRSISVHATLLGKGAEYSCTFHRIPFKPKYGIREAYARYYLLYPRRFRKNPNVHPGYYGICAEYASWQYPNPDSCRFMNATWEWCHGSDRSWGDLLNTVNPSGKNLADFVWVDTKYCERNGRTRRLKSAEISREQFDQIQGSRFSNGYYCGVANGFYTMSLANISRIHAEPFKDSHATENAFGKNDYHYAADVFAFPECSWGIELRRQLSALMGKFDLGGIAFDVSNPRGVYRGARLKKMKNVSWDKYGPGVVRGVANAKVFDYLRTLSNSKLPGSPGAAVNTRYHHVGDMLYADTVMHETTPWENSLPFPMHSRLALGEKALTLWEGYSLKTFDPNYRKWPQSTRDMLINSLGRFAVHRSLATCASLPTLFMSEYAARISHAFVRLNAAGWKPVTGAIAKGSDWELARYGLGDKSFIAVCNLTNLTRMAEIEVFPGEIATGLVEQHADGKGYLYAPFYGGAAKNSFYGAKTHLTVEAGALLVNVLEAVAKVDGNGSLSAEWKGDGCGRMELKLTSIDFNGRIACRKTIEGYHTENAVEMELKSGESTRLEYCDRSLANASDAILSLELNDLTKLNIEHASDADSKEIAERFAFFFKSVTLPKDAKAAKTHQSPVRMAMNGKLKPLCVRLGSLEVTADNRVQLSQLARRVLNVLNAKRYPMYTPTPKMESSDAKYFNFLRY